MSEVHDRLDSWKAIAEYLDRDPTTVMRWAKERGLPVHVVQGEGHRRRAVYAFKTEIDVWLKKPAPPGLHLEKQSEIPTEARNDKGSADEPPPGVQKDAESTNGETSRAGFLAPLGMTTVTNGTLANDSSANGSLTSTSVTNGSFWSRLGGRWGLWAVFLGGAFLIALGAGAWLAMPAPEPKVLGLEQLTNDGLEKRGHVLTDGARLYFLENSRDGWVVVEIPSTGGSPVAIARASEVSDLQDISPDHTELLLVEDTETRPGPVWILPLLAGSRRRLGTLQAFSAAWAPDGTTLAYTTDEGLYICDPNGANSRRIVAMSGRLDNARWSPDGQHLCFVRVSSTKATVWEVDRVGKGLGHLLPDWDILYQGSWAFWTPDGEYLVAQTLHAGHAAPCIVRVSAGLFRRRGQPTLLGAAGINLGAQSMSPDRSRLYCGGLARPRYEIERFDVRSERLVPFLPDIAASTLDFAKDGQWVAYVDDHKWLWKSRSDGSDKVQLTLPPLQADFPRWSPDGKWIAFMGQDTGQPWKVRVVSAEGGPYGPVTSIDAAAGAPTWSPDSSRLLFGELINSLDRPPGPPVVHLFDLKNRRLSVVPGSEGLWTARWSPDGRYIAALTEDSRSLMLFDFRAAKWTKLLTLDLIFDLRWSWRGERIYLTNIPPEGEPALFSMKLTDHRAQRLTKLHGTHDAGWLGVAPDDSPLIMHQAAGGEIYALQCQFPK